MGETDEIPVTDEAYCYSTCLVACISAWVQAWDTLVAGLLYTHRTLADFVRTLLIMMDPFTTPLGSPACIGMHM